MGYKRKVDMRHRKKDLIAYDKETLIRIIGELQDKLKEKNIALRSSQTRLNVVKGRMNKMKNTVEYQRQRIIQLHT